MGFLKFLLELWKKFAAVLGWINTRILLTLIYFALISPFVFILRLSGKEFLDLKIDKNADTYWEDRPTIKPGKETYYRQF